MIGYWNQPRRLKQRKLSGGRWPDYLALWLAVCSEINTLKGMPLWNGCLSNQNLNQTIALQKKKKGKRNNCQGLHCTENWIIIELPDIRRKGRYNILNNIFLQKISKSESLEPVNVTLCDKKDFADVIVCVCPIFKWRGCPELSKVKVLVTQSCPTLQPHEL